MSKVMFTNNSWRSITELKNALIEAGKDLPKKETVEIERKWYVKDGPELARLLEHDAVYHDESGQLSLCTKHHITAYLSTDPEIRVRASYDNKFNLDGYFIAYKGPADETGLERIELEFETTMEIFSLVLSYATMYRYPYFGSVAIQRTVWIAEYEDGLCYELKCADHGIDWQLEIEFPDRESAEKYQMRPEFEEYVGMDVTNNPYYKIKGYWFRTRNMHPFITKDTSIYHDNLTGEDFKFE